ncbi:MAG TPA: RDD family protein [Stenomitos sp.]
MAPDPAQNLQTSIPSLSIGNIVTVGLQIFRLHFNDHFVRSLLAHLLIWFALIAGMIGVALVAALAMGLDAGLRLQGFATVIGVVVAVLGILPFLLFILGRFTALGGLMTRMGVNTLNRRVEPEELHRQTILQRPWKYLGAAVLFGLVLLVAVLACMGVFWILFVLLLPYWKSWELQLTDPQTDWVLTLGGVLLGLSVILVLGLVVYYLTARLWLFDAVLAMEPQYSALTALQRSWRLTRGKGWSITTVMFVVTLVTLPFSLLATVLNLFLPIFGLVFAVMTFPLWQAVKAVNYYELAALRTGLAFDLFVLPPDPRRYLRRVAIQTPEEVELDFTLGGAGSRALAWITDQVILWVLLALLTVAGAFTYAGVLLPILVERLDVPVDKLNLWAAAIASVIGFVIANGYFIAWETLWRGQTPGKRLARIRVVRDNGQPIGVKEATLRSLVGWFDSGFLFIGAFLIIFSRSEKRLGDLAAGTLVIQSETAGAQDLQVVPAAFDSLTDDTVEVLLAQPDLQPLSMDHYFVLQNFLGYRSRLSRMDCQSITEKLAQQLRTLFMPSSPEQLGTIPDETLVEAAYVLCRSDKAFLRNPMA